LEIINIAQKITQIEKDEKVFGEIINEINSINGVIWVLSLYIDLVVAQYKRFLELIYERKQVPRK